MYDANEENTPLTDNDQSVTLEPYSPWNSSLTRFGGFLFVAPFRHNINSIPSGVRFVMLYFRRERMPW
jgi:hypothetical protein